MFPSNYNVGFSKQTNETRKKERRKSQSCSNIPKYHPSPLPSPRIAGDDPKKRRSGGGFILSRAPLKVGRFIRRIHDRNKYEVKRARILFTEEYNCQKNKRSQVCLLAPLSPPPSLFSLLSCVTAVSSISLSLPFFPSPFLLLFSLLSLSFFNLLPSRANVSLPLLRLGGKAHSTRGSTNSQLRSFTSTWLPTLSSTLESRTIFLPAMEEPHHPLSSFFSASPSFSPFFPLHFLASHPRSRSSSVGFSRLSFPGCWLFSRQLSLSLYLFHYLTRGSRNVSLLLLKFHS